MRRPLLRPHRVRRVANVKLAVDARGGCGILPETDKNVRGHNFDTRERTLKENAVTFFGNSKLREWLHI